MIFKKYGLYAAWVLSLFSVLVSLYFSEVKHLEPCHMCWYQRILLFPLALILGIACYRGFWGISFYVLPQIVLGFLIAGYQVAIQEIPGFNPIDICGNGPNCATKQFIGLGPITIPMLSTLAFLLLIILLSATHIMSKGEKNYEIRPLS
jgi:disulfide bond formation protein DsbB